MEFLIRSLQTIGDGMANIGIGISGKYSKYKSAKEYLDEFDNYLDMYT